MTDKAKEWAALKRFIRGQLNPYTEDTEEGEMCQRVLSKMRELENLLKRPQRASRLARPTGAKR